MSDKNWFTELEDEFKDDIKYLTELQILHFTALVANLMKESQVSQTELAKRLDVPQSFITKLLNGDQDMTIKTMVAVLSALGSQMSAIYTER